MRWAPLHRLRARITLVASLVTLAMMTVAAVAMLVFQERQLFDAVDVSLGETVGQVQTDLDVSFDRFSTRGPRRPAGADFDARVTGSGRSVQLLSGDGRVLAASGALIGEPALIEPSEVLDGTGDATGAFSTAQGDTDRFRVVATDVNDELVLVVGYSLADVDESLRTQRRTLAVAIPMLSALLGLLIWQVLGRALKPVEAIREEVSAIGGSELDRRVPVPERSVELASLATTMNEMLDRLDHSATRQRRFVSDAAHELRSPLAGIRGHLEVNVHHPEAPDRAEAERAMLRETVRMQELVDNLLVLARADHADTGTPWVAVDLDDLVLEEASQLRRSSDLQVHVDAVSAAQVRGDAAQLRRVVRNLIDNAGRHATSAVVFELREELGHVHLAVADDGPGIPPAEAEAVFDRFTRLDESRDRDAGGSGLGLAISREIVKRHGGTIAVDTASTGGARFVISLPRA